MPQLGRPRNEDVGMMLKEVDDLIGAGDEDVERETTIQPVGKGSMEGFEEDGDEMIGVVSSYGVGRLESELAKIVDTIFSFEDDSLFGVGEEEPEKVGDRSSDLKRLFAHFFVLFLFRRLRFSFTLERNGS